MMSFDAFLIILYLFSVLVVLVMTWILYFGCSSKRFEFNQSMKIVLYLFLPLATILFLPITEVFLSVMKC